VRNDCNDAAPGTHPTAPEVCDLVDNNCDGATDEGVLHRYYADADGDGYGDVSDATGWRRASFRPGCRTYGTTATMPRPRSTWRSRTLRSGDPPVDENCDGVANPATLCMCTGTEARPCSLPGACAAGVEMCSGGSFGACSVAPSVEICNDIDDDCDGSVDETLRVLCFIDADNDGFAAAGATDSTLCPQSGREAVGGCPATFTNRAPEGADIDATTRPRPCGPARPRSASTEPRLQTRTAAARRTRG